jgi:RNA polymerase sigma-70 factor (ECF subfamily)
MDKEEKKIIKKLSKGDLSTFEKVFKTYYEELCFFAKKYLSDMDQAEEIVQDMFYTIWQNRENLKINQSLKAYLYASTKNKCLKKIRSRQYEEKYRNYVKHSNPGNVSTPDEELNAKEINVIIEETLSSLPERTKKIFKMSRYQGMKYREIADKLAISVKTVEADMGRALKVFRRNLTEYQQAS